MPEGKLVIAGIRPEYFEDAAVDESHTRAHGSTFRATVDVIEWLGNEAYAYIPYEAPPEVATQLAQLEKELDSEHCARSSSCRSTRSAGSARARRPSSGSTRGRCTCSTPARRQPHPDRHGVTQLARGVS